MSKVYLMNAAMIPCDGTFIRRSLDFFEFRELLQNSEIVSSIGYQDVADLILTHVGVKVSISRELTELQEQEGVILVMKLKYRISDTHTKGIQRHLNINEYEFLEIRYTKT